MATKNLSYKDALAFKKNNCYIPAFKYFDIVNNQFPASETISLLNDYYFLNLNENHHFFNSKKIKHKHSSL